MTDILCMTPEQVAPAQRTLAVEVPIAIEYGGIGYAVMMASPQDLDDFGVGFSLSEQLVASAQDVIDIRTHEGAHGWHLRITLKDNLMAPVLARARQRISEGSCGLCGLESLEQVMRPLPPVPCQPLPSRAALFHSLKALDQHQPMHAATGAAHVAAFCNLEGAILLAREDVGRHNALDKLIGALARAGMAPAAGYFLLSARCSYELVEKTVLVGCPLLMTLSAATTLAVDRARAHGLTLISLARSDSMLLHHDAQGHFSRR